MPVHSPSPPVYGAWTLVTHLHTLHTACSARRPTIVRYHNKRYRGWIRRQIAADVLISACWFVCAFTSGVLLKAAWWTAIAVDIAMFLMPVIYKWILGSKVRSTIWGEKVPLHPDLLVSRHNRFQIITYGYVVSAALASLNSPILRTREAVILAMACILVVGMKVQYFDLQPVPRPSHRSDAFGSRHPVMRSSSNDATRVLWELLHFPLNMSTVLVGSTLKLFTQIDDHEEPRLSRYFLTIPIGVGSVVTILQQVTKAQLPPLCTTRQRLLSRPSSLPPSLPPVSSSSLRRHSPYFIFTRGYLPFV